MAESDTLDLTNLPRFLVHLEERRPGFAALPRQLLDAGWQVQSFWGPVQMDVWSLRLRRDELAVIFGIERGVADGGAVVDERAPTVVDDDALHVLDLIGVDVDDPAGDYLLVFRQLINWPIDADGNRRPFAAIPDHVSRLTDNPWRTLARRVRAFESDLVAFARDEDARSPRQQPTLIDGGDLIDPATGEVLY